jgi:hypothetical protein
MQILRTAQDDVGCLEDVDDGQVTVIKGLEMNNLVAAVGLRDLRSGTKPLAVGGLRLTGQIVCPRAKVIIETRLPWWLKGVDMLQGLQDCQKWQETMEKGIAMNDQVAQSKLSWEVCRWQQGHKGGMGTMAKPIGCTWAERMYLSNNTSRAWPAGCSLTSRLSGNINSLALRRKVCVLKW